MLGGRFEVHPLPVALGHNGQELLTHAPGASLGAYVLERHGRAGGETAGALAGDGSLWRLSVAVGSHLVPHGLRCAVHDRLDPHLPRLLVAQQEALHQRNVATPRRVRRGHGARPQPGDHIGLASAVLGGQIDLRVQVADAALGLVSHPAPVVAHIGGQALRARPLPEVRSAFLIGMDRRPTGKPGRDLDHCLVYEHRHGVEVRGVHLEAQALRLQRD